MASSTAMFLEMACLGAADKVLTGCSVELSHMTLWRFMHMKHTAFALEPVEIDSASGNARFGAQNVKYTFQRQGDLVWHCYAKIFLKGIVGATGTSGHYVIASGTDAVYYTNAIGQHILTQVKLAIGGTTIDTLYDTFLYMWEELSGKPGKRLGEMIGKYDTQDLRQSTSKRSRWLYVPLPFYFTENTGLALPLVSLQFHQVSFEICLATRASCIVDPQGNNQIYVRPDGETGTDTLLASASSLTLLTDQDIIVLIEACYVYLDHDERSKFAHGQFECLTSELQQHVEQANCSSYTSTPALEGTKPVQHQLKVLFNHVIMEYIFAVRSQDKVDNNLHMDFSGYQDANASELYLDPVLSVEVLFNNQQRVQPRPGSFFRLVQPYQHHTNIPRDFIYVWSYGVDPEDAQPTGGANHSRIDNVVVKLLLDARIFNFASSADIIFYGRNKNLLRFKHGLIAKKFA